MLLYWLLFAYFGLGTLLSPKPGSSQPRLTPLLLAGAILTAVMIGFRYKVGADWDTYEYFFRWRGSGPHAPAAQEIGYSSINWAVQWLGLDMWAVNLVCGAIFTWGLFRFCLAQREPWLAVLIAIPYMVIVVAMGYTRQAVALGILMAGLAASLRGASTVRFGVYSAAAALFHKTAVMVLPLVAMAKPRNRLANLIVAVAGAVLLYDLFLGSSVDRYFQNYVHRGYSSSGAGIRLAMNFIAAAILATANRRLGFNEIEWKIWRNFSWASVLLLVVLFISPSSTAVDRMSIYVMPLQIAVLSRVPLLLTQQVVGRLLVIIYLAAVQFVWLNFAQHSEYWVPYQFFPL